MNAVPLWGQAGLAAGAALALGLPVARFVVVLPASPRAAFAVLVAARADPGRWTTAVTTGAAAAAAVSWLLVSPAMRALTAWTVAALVLLAVTDLRTGRLPNPVVGGAAVGCVALMAWSERTDPAAGSITGAAVASTVTFLGFATAAVLLPRSLGMGDAKLLALVAFVIGYRGSPALTAFWGVLALASLGTLLVVRRLLPTGGRRLVPFGPVVCVAAVTVLWAG